MLVKIERYPTGKDEVRMSVMRIFLLRIVSIYAVLYGLYKTTNLANTPNTPAVDQYDCAGTTIGQEFYKLIVLDTLVQMGAPFAVNLIFMKW